MIDYLVNPDVDVPMISTVKPLPINPWKMWKEGMNAQLLEKQQIIEADALEVAEQYDEEERQLDASAQKEIRAKETVVRVESSSDDDEDMFGEIVARKAQKVANAKAAEIRKKTEAKLNKTKKTDMLFIMHAVANIKAASMQMKKKLGKTTSEEALVSSTNREFVDMTYRDIFHLKQVTPADLKYYNDRLTTEDILRRVDREINAEPVFEWFPINGLSPKQRAAQNARMMDQVDDAVMVRNICMTHCTRKNETEQGSMPYFVYTIILILSYITGEIVARVTREVEAEKARKRIEKETRAALQATAGPVVMTRADGIDANDLCEVHCYTGQKKRCTRKAFLFFSGLKICRNVDCTSKFPADNNEATAQKPPASCDIEGCNNECYTKFEGKAYCTMHLEQRQTQARGNKKVKGKGKGKKDDDDESDDGEDSDDSQYSSSSSSLCSSRESSQKQHTEVIRPNRNLGTAPTKRGLSPTSQHKPQFKIRPDADECLKECKASIDEEITVLRLIRNNIDLAERLVQAQSGPAQKIRRSLHVNKCTFIQTLTEKLQEILNFSACVKGITSLASRLNLNVGAYDRKLEKYVTSFVKEFVLWYTAEGVVEPTTDGENGDGEYWSLNMME